MHILQNVNTAFEGRRICGVIGPNGCGKTTLLRHLYRNLGGYGHVFIDGKDAHSFSGREFARKVAVMMQHQNIVEKDLQVRDVIRMGRYPYKNLLTGYNRQDDRIVDSVVERTGLGLMQERRISTLSGGEMQRVMIAKCFAQQPETIILDEPANHLDIRYKVELMKMLSAYEGLVIMTLHDLNLAAVYCDRIYVMNKGSIICSGKPEEVLRQDLLRDIYQVDIKISRNEGEMYISIG